MSCIARKQVLGLRPRLTQTALKITRGLKFFDSRLEDCTIYVAKNKGADQLRGIVQLICTFVFAYAKSRADETREITFVSSHDSRGSFPHPYQLSLVVRKPVFGVSDQVPHKPGCTATEDG